MRWEEKFLCNTHPSQIFFTLFFSWSPWKKMMNTDLWTWSPCGKKRRFKKTYRTHSRVSVSNISKQYKWWHCVGFFLVCVCYLCGPWRGPPEGPRSLPSSGRRSRDTLSTASSRRSGSAPCRSLRPRSCTDQSRRAQKEKRCSQRLLTLI